MSGLAPNLTPEEINFVQLVMSRCPYTGVPNTLAEYLERYVMVMNKLEKMKEEPKEPEQMHLEGVGV